MNEQEHIDILEKRIENLEKQLSENNVKLDELKMILQENIKEYSNAIILDTPKEDIKIKERHNTKIKNDFTDETNRTKPKILIKRKNKPVSTNEIKMLENDDMVSKDEYVNQAQPLLKRRKIQKTGESSEQMVGKYIIGALSALLLFIATGSYVSIIWHKMTDDIKLGLIFAVGTILSITGYFFIRKEKNPIFAVILGAGAGVTYIGIISANLAFHKINSITTLILCLIWAILFIVLSNKIDMFFTTIIAYIGSYITLILASNLMNSEKDAVMISIFAIIVTVAIIGNTYRSNKKKIRTTIFLSFITFITLYEVTAEYDNVRVLSLVIQSMLLFLGYKIENTILEDKQHYNYIFLTLVYASNLAFYILFVVNNGILPVQKYFILFGIALSFFILINIFFKNIIKKYETLYAIFICLVMCGMHNTVDDYMFGLCIVCIILFALSKIFTREINYTLMTAIVAFDSVISLVWVFLAVDYNNIKSLNMLHYIYNVVNIAILGLIVYSKYKKKEFDKLSKYKILAMTITIVCILSISCFIKCGIGDYYDVMRMYDALTYATVVSMMLILNMVGYFKDWSDEKFTLVSHKGAMDDYNLIFAFYIISTILYIFGVASINIIGDKEYIVYINAISLIAITVLQSSKILSKNQSYGVHILLGIKYLILTFTILYGVLHIDTASFIYNIAGLVIALSSIALGFNLNMKGLREYGLFLTILVVVKFILIDMQGTNSMQRILSMTVGAVLCFAISFIYNKISDKYNDTK